MDNKIAFYRSIKKYSQQKLAKEVGITRPYLSDIENCKKKPSCHIALKIAKVLDVSVEEIFFNKSVNYSIQNII
ncbi:helix-turn-helix transcriptional regulator [Clostridium tetani]|uniref:HTH cro/C1-type domain-containing protein n=1 Tax=Clostridium tetani TaxID=1513 RepID=A0ABC8EBV3_CLOTA|nr:helix-turn-helix domain-containing protein [Clostridium tetani]BDR81064.1 hypothetical protein K234311028_13100 [Clostridium tetani]